MNLAPQHDTLASTTPAPPRHAALLAGPAWRAFAAAPGFPLPDAAAMHRVGSPSAEAFLQTGWLLAAALEAAAGPVAGRSVLDIGCGWGRLALPLARRLGPAGRYLGMDAAAEAIAWCRRAIAAGDRRFGFHHADIRNSYANPRGRIEAARAVLLPWEERFDLVVANSLFTHLLPAATARYVAEAARLCRPGGVLFATFFLLDEAAGAAIAAGRAAHAFPAAAGPARLAHAAVPEDAVAYPPAHVLGLLDAAGFEAAWRPGAWAAREGAEPFDYQDVVIARRRGAAADTGALAGAVEGLSAGRLRGWAWDRAAGAAPPLRLEVEGAAPVALHPDLPRDDLPEAGPPAGARCGFRIALPPAVLGTGKRRLRVTAGALVLLDRPAAPLPDPLEELARAWRRAATARGAWGLAGLAWDGDALVLRLACLPPPGLAPRPVLRAEGARLALEPLPETDPGLDAAFGLPEGSLRPWHRAVLRAGGRPVRLTLEFAPEVPADPAPGLVLPGLPGPDPWAAAERLAVAAAVRRVAGLDLDHAGALVPADLAALAAAPAGGARLLLAGDLLARTDAEGEAALAAALRRAVAPGGLVLAASPGRGAWLAAAGAAPAFLAWQREGVAPSPAAGAPGFSRTPQRLAALPGFALAALEELALPGLRDLAVLRGA